MKIEVTFEKTAKKEFRDECIKRLQNFVNQIKGKKDTTTRRNSIVSADEESKSSTARENICSYLRETQVNCMKRDDKNERVFKKQNHMIDARSNQNSQTKVNSCKQNKKQYKPVQTAQTKGILEEGKAFNIIEMKDKVNQILQKLDKTSKMHISHHDHIEKKLESTNKKLDYLIECIQKKGIVSTVSVDSPSMLTQQRARDSFEERFNDLANKYFQIKERSSKASTQGTFFFKSISSLQQTQDSATFRQSVFHK